MFPVPITPILIAIFNRYFAFQAFSKVFGMILEGHHPNK
jgi:hypothetical protein